MNSSDQRTVWQFIRGDLPAVEFEKWLYANKDFEEAAGQDFHLQIISTNFNTDPDVYVLKEKLEAFMRQEFPLNCECIALPNLAVIDMGSEQENRLWETLNKIKKYGEPRWWLVLYCCQKCQQYWLVAHESRQNDIHCLKRLESTDAERIIQTNEWPECFETLEELFAIGRDNDRSARFFDPLNSSLVYSVDDLLKARPNISIPELASLLNIDENLAIQMYNKVRDV